VVRTFSAIDKLLLYHGNNEVIHFKIRFTLKKHTLGAQLEHFCVKIGGW